MTTTELDLRTHPLAPAIPASGRQIWSLDVRQASGVALIALGLVGVVVAWYGISGTLDPGQQMPYLASGGIGGVSAIAIGVTLLVACEHARDRAALGQVLDRMDEIEERLERLSEQGNANWAGKSRSRGATRRPPAKVDS